MNDDIDDRTLMLRFQDNGDVAAFERLFRRNKDAFVSFLTRLSGNAAVAEDVSQQVWLKLIDVAREARYVATADFRTYLYTLGRNRYIDDYHRKHEESRTRSLTDSTPAIQSHAGEAARPEEILADREYADALNSAISTLPMEQRDVVAMWASGLSFKLIGQVTGAPRDTVISRKKYGIKKLRTALLSMGIAGDIV